MPAMPIQVNENRLNLRGGAPGSVTGALNVTATNMPVDGDPTTSLALGDVDGDGDLDLVIGNYGRQNRLYLNDGKGRFTDGTASRIPAITDTTRAVVLGSITPKP